MQKSKIKVLLKVLISILTLWLAWQSIDIQHTWEVIQNGNPLWLLPATTLFILSKWCNAERLRLWYRHVGIPLTLPDSTRLYWKGMLYSLILPGGISGDGYKIWWLKQQTTLSYARLIKVHIWDRVSGMVALLGLAAMLWGYISNALVWGISIFFILQALYFVLYLILQKKSISIYPSGMAWAVAVQVLQALCAWSIGHLLQIESGLSSYILVFLISSIGAAIPISIGGIGIRELVFISLAPYAMLNNSTALLFSTLFFVISVYCTIPSLWIKLPKHVSQASNNPD